MRRLTRKQIQKIYFEPVLLHESPEGHQLKALLRLTDEKIIYHVVPDGSNITEVLDDLDKALLAYNKL